MNMEMTGALWLEALVALLILIGGVFMLVGSVALVKLPDFFTRLHGPTKSTTLGIGATLLASVIWFSAIDGELRVHELVISLFLFITAPVSAYMLGKAALHRHRPTIASTQNPSVRENAERQRAND
ncbi:Na+/H+ antiporter subunit G [Thalassolituus sp.]|jgi:multicomponent K+:H+ antiporter subunit G|uniref:Na+/H+ antiporter subunit G n=1 Tax=Thalassolituus sp. TaxID=2030822 RepID=UPI002A838D1B|nr:Na+/H+ antiporter subunit G [Thalassolituus sp.]|tara:strand:- start:3618 stop:3995 length:378 start_codon:yes stop_codon:yes gene_type:complete